MLVLACLFLANSQEPAVGHPIALPTIYSQHRFVVTPKTSDGKDLRFYTDSAGGMFLSLAAAKRLGVPLTDSDQPDDAGGKMQQTPFPTFKDGQSIPPPVGIAPMIPVLDLSKIPDRTDLSENDGMLGQQWFEGRTWTFDYPGRKLWWRANGDLPNHDPIHESKLFFKKGKSGQHETAFARFQVKIDGEVLDFLFDTGATDNLTPEALEFVGDKMPAARATSFMAKSLFEKLHAAHPDWKVFDKRTATGQKLFQVPTMEIGGFVIGPVWFSIQGDNAFHNYMAQWMDKQTEGAIGGSALHYLRVTVDWPGEIAVFEKP